MRITWLLETADQMDGGVGLALNDANWLHDRGHRVTVLSRAAAPQGLPLACTFQQVQDFRAEHLPDADVVVATFWTTVPWAASAGAEKGVPVHYCLAYAADAAENVALRDRIESAYRLPHVQRVTTSPFAAEQLRQRLGLTAHQVGGVIDHRIYQATAERAAGSPLRVGLLGAYGAEGKDLATGFAACRLAHRAGQKLVLVRATDATPHTAEQQPGLPIEWHREMQPNRLADYYRSLDVLLVTDCEPAPGVELRAIEAMACGVPTVLPDTPFFRSCSAMVGHDRFAVWVPARDPAAMAESIVVAGGLPEVRGALRREGLQLAAQYHGDRHGQQLEAALLACLESRAAAKPHPLRLVPERQNGAEPDVAGLLQQLRRGGDFLRQHQQPARAATLLAAAHCLCPDDNELLRDVGNTRLQAGLAETALAAFDQLAARGVDDEALHVGRGHALHALGQLQPAAQAFRAALAIGTRTADAYNRLGVVLFQAGDLSGARQSFERALVLQPDHNDAQANLAALPAA